MSDYWLVKHTTSSQWCWFMQNMELIHAYLIWIDKSKDSNHKSITITIEYLFEFLCWIQVENMIFILNTVVYQNDMKYENAWECAFYPIINNFNALTLHVKMYIIQFKLLAFNIKFNIDEIRLFTLHLNKVISEAKAVVWL